MMVRERVQIHYFTSLYNSVRCPSAVDARPAFGHEVTATENAGDRNHDTLRGVPLTDSRNCIELAVGIRSGKRSKKLGVCEMCMGTGGVRAKALHLGREGKQGAHLRDTITWGDVLN